MQKYNKYKKQYQKDQQTIKFVDKLNEKSLQKNYLTKMNIYLCVVYLILTLMKRKTNLFSEYEH